MGSYNRKQCTQCEAFIYDGCTVCARCASYFDLCESCGESKELSHGPDCIVGAYETTNDMDAKIAACDALVDAFEGMTVGEYMSLPMSLRVAFTEVRCYTKANGYKVNR